jgi:hypothetical protein
VLTELLRHSHGGDGEGLLAISSSWSGGPEPVPRPPDLSAVMPADYWTSILRDDSDPELPSWAHLWVSATQLHSADLSELLLQVADEKTGGVILTASPMTWLYAPYDGGADVIAASRAQRDQLRQRHSDWLSAYPSGL